MKKTFARASNYLTKEEHEGLKDLAYKKKVSMPQLIRYALDKVYFDGEQKQ